MLYYNSSQPCTIPSDLLTDAAFDSSGPRPATVTVPPYGIVDIRPEYGLRRSGGASGQTRPSVVHEMTGGRMTPRDGDSAELYANTLADQLPNVILAHAKQATGHVSPDGLEGVSARPADDRVERERKLNEEAGKRMRAALGDQAKEQGPRASLVLAGLDER